jgi:ribonuclease P protein component
MVASAFRPERPEAVLTRLKKRSEFLEVQKGRRINTGLFVVQTLVRPGAEGCRVGFTVSKRVSPSSVIRNRIRRRLKEAVRLEEDNFSVTAPFFATPADFVLVARFGALTAPFVTIRAELTKALLKAAQPQPHNSALS